MNKPEIFDAYDKDGNKLGIDMIRGEKHEEGLYHLVVDLFVITKNHEILMTKRHPQKTFPLMWEIPGGSVLKGEDEYLGAIRELKEETGLIIFPSDLRLVGKCRMRDCLYREFLALVDMQEHSIKLQEEETIDYRLIDIDEFENYLFKEDFVPTLKERFLTYKDKFYQTIKEIYKN